MFSEFRRSGTDNILVIHRTMTYIALKVARFSSKKESSMVKNLDRTSKKVKKYYKTIQVKN